MTQQIFWPMITTLAVIAAIINFAIAVTRRQYTLVALVRAAAGLASFALAAGIILDKTMQWHIFQSLNRLRLHRALGPRLCRAHQPRTSAHEHPGARGTPGKGHRAAAAQRAG